MVLYSSVSASGPFGSRTHVYSTPESGLNRFTYDAHVHPEFTDASGMLVSYDLNTFKASQLLDDVDSYRPRFIRVKIGGR